jgi:hypothetical protein
MKLPKQWAHWCYRLGLKSTATYSNMRKWRWTLLKKGQRFYRINCLDEFQVSDLDFDRWANSVESTHNIPQTFEEFRRIVK